MRGWVARYADECGLCGAEINPGDWCAYCEGEVVHAECAESEGILVV